MSEQGEEPASAAAPGRDAGRFRALADAVDGWVLELDAAGRVSAAGDAFRQQTGFDREDLRGTPGSALFDGVLPDSALDPVSDDTQDAWEETVSLSMAAGEEVVGTLSVRSFDAERAGAILVFEPGTGGGTDGASTDADVGEGPVSESEAATRRRYETLVENFPNGAVALVDHDLRYTTVGGTPVDSTTDTASELDGKTVREALSEDFADVLEPKYEAALEGERSTFEHQIEDRYTRIWTFPVRDDEGNIVAAMGMSQDITAQKERERELATYESLVETVNDGIYVVDDDTRYTTVNEAFTDITGYSEAELLGAHASLVVDEETIERGRRVRDSASGMPSMETILYRKDGEPVPVEVTFSSLETLDGEQFRAGVVRDITERREQRRRLEESEQRYRALVENFPNGGVGVYDEDLRYTLVDGTMWERIEPDPEDLEGETIWEALPPETAADVEPVFRAALEGETNSVVSSLGGRTYRVWATPLRDADGEITAAQSMAVDITELKEHEQELERTLDLLEQTERTADVGGWEIDPETMDVFWSDHLFEILGVEGETEPPLDEALDVYHPDDRPIVEDAVNSALESGEAFDVDARFHRPDGERRWLHIQGTPETADGEVVSLRGAAQDVTERKEREQFLEDAKAQMEAAAEAGAVGTWEWHVPEDRFVAGASLANLFGVDPEEAREGVPLERLVSSIHEDDRERVEAAIEAAIESGGEYEEEYRVRDADDELRWVVARGHVETDEDGNPTTFPGAITDITEKKRVEQELARQRRQLETLIDLLPVAVFVAESDGEIVQWNEAAVDIWGGEIVESQTVAEYEEYDGWWAETGEPLAPEDWPLARALDGEEVTDPDLIEIEGFDGERRIVLNHATPVRDEDGNVSRAIVTLVDITERREYQRKLEASNERLEQFAYAASHDLQEPLRMVSSYLSLVEQRYGDELDEDGREFIEFAVDGAERMQEMIDALLEYSRVETEGGSFEPVDLGDVFADVRRDFQLKIEQSDADVEVGELPVVRGDADQLRQVFGNLLSNAIEYSGDAPPSVEVSAERDGDEWVVAVSDDGIGIEAEHTDRVFEVFQRLHTIDEHSGTGIGLALCQRIVERHGGTIWVESTPGEGATFYFTVPVSGQDDG